MPRRNALLDSELRGVEHVTRSGEKQYGEPRREPTFGRRALNGAGIALAALAAVIMVAGFFL